MASGLFNPSRNFFRSVGRRTGGDGIATHQMRQIWSEAAHAVVMHPLFELGARLHVDAQQHLGMLGSAILSALAKERARFVRVDPHLIWMIRNQIVSCLPVGAPRSCGPSLRKAASENVGEG